MMEFLKIENLALLERAEVDFKQGFTVVTGETGAGKSVLLGALSMLAGARKGREIVGGYSDTCRVEAVLRFADTSEIDALLESAGLPPCEDGALLIARTISATKPAKAFVNSSPASLSFLAELGKLWIDFHGPGEPQKLFSGKNQLAMLDTFAGDSAETAEYMKLYGERKQTLSALEKLEQGGSLGADEVEFLKSRIAAIDAVNPTEDSIAELERQSKIAESSSDITEKSAAAAESINGDGGALASVAAAAKCGAEIARFSPEAKALCERLSGAALELSDIAAEYENLARSSDMDEAQIAQIREKMTDWLGLCRKYGGGGRAGGRGEGPADGVARILARLHEDVRQHRAGRGLAVRTGNGDGAASVHQQGEDVAAVHDAGAFLRSGDDFRVIGLDGAGVYDGVRFGHVFGTLAELHGDAQGFQTVGFSAVFAIRTVDLDASLMEHFGKDAHAGASDADEMGMPQHFDALIGAECRSGGGKGDGCSHDNAPCWIGSAVFIMSHGRPVRGGWPMALR